MFGMGTGGSTSLQLPGDFFSCKGLTVLNCKAKLMISPADGPVKGLYSSNRSVTVGLLSLGAPLGKELLRREAA